MPRAKNKDSVAQAKFPGIKIPPDLEIALVEELLPGDLPPERWLHATRIRAMQNIALWAGLIEAAGKSGSIHAVNVRRVRGGRQGRSANTLVHDAIKGLRTLWVMSPGSDQKPELRQFEFVWSVARITKWKDGLADASARRHELRRLFRDSRCSPERDLAIRDTIANTLNEDLRNLIASRVEKSPKPKK